MKTHRPKTNWLIDLALFVGFLVAFVLDLTGLPLHQLLGVLVGAVAGYHLLAHWTWVKSVTAGLCEGTANKQCRTYYALDAGIMFGLFLTVLNGLVISTWLNLPLTEYFAWRTFHVGVSVVTLLLVVLKIGLHWRWIVTIAKRHIFNPAAPAARPGVLQPAAVPVTAKVDRREFLKLMGIVGVTATLALGSALNDTLASLTSAAPLDAAAADTAAGAAADATAASSAASAQPITQAAVQGTQTVAATAAATATPVKATTTTGATTSSACVVRCSRGCSYPGQCRKYTDANNNKRCDLGECM